MIRNHAAILQKENPFNNKQFSQQKDFDEGNPFCLHGNSRMPLKGVQTFPDVFSTSGGFKAFQLFTLLGSNGDPLPV